MTITYTASATSGICTVTVTDPTNATGTSVNIAQTTVPALAAATVTLTSHQPR